ncbi:Putative Sterol uptake control protein 2 [[Torrubiella] hemipterigena]|uniref:Putative Sterol uptake control protein 2 n=1 Tax=[Torrubiella] hemipterigena TaxID=1531966 RepID=A0A0A1SIF1_9HYPO|nr:Putative Sterol uptake control protein 2 [[Torrubiella] hemipterigena]
MPRHSTATASPLGVSPVTPDDHNNHHHATTTSTSPVIPNTPGGSALKTRRSHRKSRNGCAECKRRHIRCDERRPECSNCSIADRACAYPNAAPTATAASNQNRARKADQQQQRQDNVSPASSGHAVDPCSMVWTPAASDTAAGDGQMYLNNGYPQHPSKQYHQQQYSISDPPTPHTTDSPGLASIAHSPHPGQFNAQHLMLLHHAVTDMDHGGVGPPGQMQQIVSIAICRTTDAPYLIDEMLALSALHIASQLPDDASPQATRFGGAMSVPALQRLATELQTRAVTSFTRLTKGIAADDTETCVPRFLFSSILSLHSLAETLTVLRSDDVNFHSFIDRFVDCFHLHRGVRAVIQPTFQFLIQSELRPLLEITHQAVPHSQTPGGECVPLQELLSTSDLADANLQACRAAVEKLQWSFDLYNNLPDRNGPHAASGFSVMVQAEYVEVLRKHRPEALVILAHYGVLLHRCRRFWMFRDAGARMIHIIAKHLGSYWHKAMAWPLRVVEVER